MLDYNTNTITDIKLKLRTTPALITEFWYGIRELQNRLARLVDSGVPPAPVAVWCGLRDGSQWLGEVGLGLGLTGSRGPWFRALAAFVVSSAARLSSSATRRRRAVLPWSTHVRRCGQLGPAERNPGEAGASQAGAAQMQHLLAVPLGDREVATARRVQVATGRLSAGPARRAPPSLALSGPQRGAHLRGNGRRRRWIKASRRRRRRIKVGSHVRHAATATTDRQRDGDGGARRHAAAERPRRTDADLVHVVEVVASCSTRLLQLAERPRCGWPQGRHGRNDDRPRPGRHAGGAAVDGSARTPRRQRPWADRSAHQHAAAPARCRHQRRRRLAARCRCRSRRWSADRLPGAVPPWCWGSGGWRVEWSTAGWCCCRCCCRGTTWRRAATTTTTTSRRPTCARSRRTSQSSSATSSAPRTQRDAASPTSTGRWLPTSPSSRRSTATCTVPAPPIFHGQVAAAAAAVAAAGRYSMPSSVAADDARRWCCGKVKSSSCEQASCIICSLSKCADLFHQPVARRRLLAPCVQTKSCYITVARGRIAVEPCVWRMGLRISTEVKICLSKKVKVAHTRLPSARFQSRPRPLAVSLQVTWVINPAVGCYYFPPGPQLPFQLLKRLLPVSLLGEQRHDGCEQFA